MKQIFQSLRSGQTTLDEVPVPRAGRNSIVVETRNTVVSSGTERMLVDFGKSNLIQKARSQPDKVRQVLDKAKAEGVLSTLEAVQAKLDTEITLGYCQAGVVVDAGAQSHFAVGDRVATNGPHAEYVVVPHTLAARIPDNVSFEQAAFAPLAAIGLQGVRLANPTLGETVVVMGLGLIGQLTVQLLQANGCRVIAVDPAEDRLALVQGPNVTRLKAGDSAVKQVLSLTNGIGADAVLLTLASDSNDPVHQAAEMSRKRGRLVLVGVTGLQLSRDDFYKKELSFAVSCSYGPGRYDPEYEEHGRDYPLPFVRWTEQRNFEACLSLMSSGQLDPARFITHRLSIDDATKAYELLTSNQSSLGIVLDYPDRGGMLPGPETRTIRLGSPAVAGKLRVGVIGAGNFASRTLVPAFKNAGATLELLTSSKGASAAITGRKLGFNRISSDADVTVNDPDVDTVAIVTRHDSHARLAIAALNAGKHVFVEKPLALTFEELAAVRSAAEQSRGILTVGFNRRFAPMTQSVRERMKKRAGPASIIITVNAGAIPRDHWTQDVEVGGGRIVGEACHFIDLARSLVGSPIRDLNVTTAASKSGQAIDDIVTIGLRFNDGSIANVHYLANGSGAFPKERVEVFFDGTTIQIDNWRKLRSFGGGPSNSGRFRRPDKGHSAEILAFAKAVRDGESAPIPYDELFEVSEFAIRAAELARR